MKLLKEAFDKERLEKLRNAEEYSDIRKEINFLWKDTDQTLENLKYSDYMFYYQTGNSHKYEVEYFKPRLRLQAAAGMCLLYDADEYLTELQNVIWAICDEYTWVLPAHALGGYSNDNWLDLFAAETAFALAECVNLFGDRLGELVLSRIKENITRRIFNTFEDHIHHWEAYKNNWVSVCAGSVACAMMILDPQRYLVNKPRIDYLMEIFINSYTDEGFCVEGHAYWTYGFGYFAYYAQMLYEFTDGQEDYFKLEKVKKMALFQQNCILRKNIMASFSDSKMNAVFALGITHLLKSKYFGDIIVPEREYRSDYAIGTGDKSARFATFIRNILWFNPELQGEKTEEKFLHAPSAGWYILSKKKYSFATIASNNNVPHNHNDIGTIIVANDKEQLICDLGMGMYKRDYFDDNTRYKILCCSSLGHSVPIIDGCGQSFGESHYGEFIQAGEDKVSISFNKAYDNEKLKKLERSAELYSDNFVLTDVVEFSDEKHRVVERFVSLAKPELNGHNVRIDNLTIEPMSECECSISTEYNEKHGGNHQIVYLIDFIYDVETSQTISLKFNLNGE